jgi:hypothetical protein
MNIREPPTVEEEPHMPMSALHRPSWISSTFDAGNLITLLAFIVYGALAWGRMEANQQAIVTWETNSDKLNAEAKASIEARFVAIETRVGPMESIVYRLTNTESQVSGVNTRIDRVVDSFGSTLKDLQKDVNGLGNKVDVLSQVIADQTRHVQSLDRTKPPE